VNEQTFDTLTRDTARGLSRRSSLAAIGATGLAALAAPIAADAKKKNKCKKKDKKCPSLEEICAPQIEDCADVVTAFCPPGDDCSRIINCCALFETCDIGAFVLCLATPPV
jgi:hypothetical protein